MHSSPPKRRVLVVDDDRGMTALCRIILERTGEFVVKEENSGKRAVDTARALAPHLILLDRHLPDRNGADIAADLGADETLRATPIVFITGDIDAALSRSGHHHRRMAGAARGDIDAALSRSGHPMLLKPVRPSDLIDTCQAWALPPDN